MRVYLARCFFLVLISLSANARQFQGLNGFQYFDRAVRVDVIRSFCQELERGYAAWEYKKAVIGVDGSEICKKAIAFESQIEDPENIKSPAIAAEQAKRNSEFWDRMQRFGATFQDSHLALLPSWDRASLINGFSVRKVGSQVRVSVAYPKIIKGLLVRPSDHLPIAGDELISVNGVPAMTVATQFIPWVSSSSSASRLVEAVIAITERSFNYSLLGVSPSYRFRRPSTGQEFTVEVRYAFGVYGQTAKSAHLHASDIAHLKAIGIVPIETVTHLRVVDHDDELDKIFDGVTEGDPYHLPSGLTDVQIFSSDNDPKLQLGKLKRGQKTVGYMQLSQFMTDTSLLFEKKSGKALNMTEALIPWMKELEAASDDVIVDLRFNVGGDEAIELEFERMLTQPSKSMIPSTLQLRVSSGMRNDLIWTVEESDESRLLSELVNEVIGRKAKSESSSFIPLTSPYRLVPSIEAGGLTPGFSGKITVLTGPRCLSSCEAMVRVLKANHRARIVGEDTPGTGVGARYRNGQLIDVKVAGGIGRITFLASYLLGAPQLSHSGESKTGLKADYSWASENRPTAPDLRLELPRDIDLNRVTDFYLKSL